MTTIAANRQCMSADRKVTDGDVSYSCIKLREINGSIVGVAGDNPAIVKFWAWYRASLTSKTVKAPEFNKKHSLAALVLTAKGSLLVYDTDCVPDVVEDDYWAIGTGRQAALAAMLLGHEPEEAIAVAQEVDTCTGGAVDTFWLKKGRVRSKD